MKDVISANVNMKKNKKKKIFWEYFQPWSNYDETELTRGLKMYLE